MNVDWAILSNSAEVQNNLAYILGAGWDTATRSPFPAPFLGSLTIRLLANRTEVAGQHALELHLIDEDGNPFAPAVGFTMGPGVVPPGWPGGWDVPAIVTLGLGMLTVPHAGRYSIEILIDGTHHKSVPFRFVEPLPTGGHP